MRDRIGIAFKNTPIPINPEIIDDCCKNSNIDTVHHSSHFQCPVWLSSFILCFLVDYLLERAKGSVLYGFKGGPAGIMRGKYVELTPEYIYPYRNQGGFDMICSGRDKIETPEQFQQAADTAAKLDLDGLLVIGGDDSNTNVCLLAENFRGKNLKTQVIGCPKTIDGDLKCKEVPISFGFDTACKIYAEMIGNVMIDARSTGKYYHFVRLMGRAASHITLECALQTHPNITIIGEEVAEKKLTLKNVTNYIVDIISKRAELSYNYGVILIPEGLIDFIPEVQQLIAELNEILAHEAVDEDGQWKKKLDDQSLQLFEFLPSAIQEQLMLERDPHGNVQVAKIQIEKMLIQMVETELEKRNQAGAYKGGFQGQSHFFGYEGRCGLPTNFDSTYCYALGYGAGALLHSGKTGLISLVGNSAAPVEEWIVSGTALTALMDVERRHGKFKLVIKKAMVELQGNILEADYLLWKITVVKELSKRLQSKRPRMKLVLSQLFSQNTTNLENMAFKKAFVESGDQSHVKEQIGTMTEKIGNSDKVTSKVSEACSSSSTKSKVSEASNSSTKSKVSITSGISTETVVSEPSRESKVLVQEIKKKDACCIQ
ncbi:pyrophosphate--fructose 6-phosphate 1-phosphotransferase subunit beta-like [Humulus lupulus]|uniref:pyrophosphate--fructose 6-phosphate 1-phosphotransferase subunit beta-like n=1 Tax=Humulus lupulus TaxID=3486 RepID=UPI002B4025A8|nr:pyrophosphate--fructose 6-phosphate 1-phosphotransferase subunit beta-like [Humulus lupulus]